MIRLFDISSIWAAIAYFAHATVSSEDFEGELRAFTFSGVSVISAPLCNDFVMYKDIVRMPSVVFALDPHESNLLALVNLVMNPGSVHEALIRQTAYYDLHGRPSGSGSR